ncbi:MAG: ATP-binding protein [Bifidobacterium sp.]|nr:ATP-binding protein [Bifidobacterium sp.]
MLPRTISDKIRDMATKFPIISLTGTRQSGKTTLLRELFPDFRYVSMEDPDVNRLAKQDMRGFLDTYDDHVIFDEAQHTPELFSYLQGIVDNRWQRPGQFILSGSQNFLLLNSISQSLAGRVAVLYLLPLSFAELTAAEDIPKTMDAWTWQGGYPRLYDKHIDPPDYFPNYIDTYVERDVRDELGVRKLSAFRRFLTQCASRAGEMLSVNSLATDSGIDYKTAQDWLSILESSFIAFRLYLYYKNYGKRLVKTPKLYFYDSGLAAYLLNIDSPSALLLSQRRGALFENAVVSEIIKRYYAIGRTPTLYYLRDYSRTEIDLIIEKSGEVEYAIEIKASATYDSHAFANITKLSDDLGVDKDHRIVVYGGDQSFNTKWGRLLSLHDLQQIID